MAAITPRACSLLRLRLSCLEAAALLFGGISMKRHSRSIALFVALALIPSSAAMMLAGCGGKTITHQAKPATDDLSITTRVKTALLNDPEIVGKIDVDTANGVVT